jgi:hypothetical protein
MIYFRMIEPKKEVSAKIALGPTSNPRRNIYVFSQVRLLGAKSRMEAIAQV